MFQINKKNNHKILTFMLNNSHKNNCNIKKNNFIDKINKET